MSGVYTKVNVKEHYMCPVCGKLVIGYKPTYCMSDLEIIYRKHKGVRGFRCKQSGQYIAPHDADTFKESPEYRAGFICGRSVSGSIDDNPYANGRGGDMSNDIIKVGLEIFAARWLKGFCAGGSIWIEDKVAV